MVDCGVCVPGFAGRSAAFVTCMVLKEGWGLDGGEVPSSVTGRRHLAQWRSNRGNLV